MNKDSYYENLKLVFNHYDEFLGLNNLWYRDEGKENLKEILEKAKEFISAVAEHSVAIAGIYLVYPKLRIDSDGSVDVIYEEMNGERFLSLNIGESDEVPYFGHDEYQNTINGKMRYSEPRIAPLLFWKV